MQPETIEAYSQQHPEAKRYTTCGRRPWWQAIPARKTIQPENSTQLALPI
jgi:hypothetical protein